MEQSQDKIDHDLIWLVVLGTRPYVPGPIEWVAKQDTKDGSNTWCFAIGKGAACLTVDEARNPTDELFRRCATEIMGFAPDSPEDIARRRKEAKNAISYNQNEIAPLQSIVAYWQRKLDALPSETPASPIDAPQSTNVDE